MPELRLARVGSGCYLDPMALTKDQVAHVARLARLELDDAALARATDQLSQILGHMEMLERITTDGIEPTSHAIPVANVFREDAAQPAGTTEATLAQAPDRDGPFYKVNKVIE